MLVLSNNASIIYLWDNVPVEIQDVVVSSLTSVHNELLFNQDVVFSVHWTELDNSIKASARPFVFLANESFLPLSDVFYPIALAEYYAGKNLNGSDPDIIMYINSCIAWSFDSLNNQGNHDLSSVVIHEFIHGLGFTGSLVYNPDNTNYLMFEGYPTIFDSYLVANGKSLVRDIEPSKLFGVVTSQAVFFEGAVVSSLFNDSIIPLYTDSIYQPGRHLYHIDKRLYDVSDPNYIMSPFFLEGEVHRELGDITIAMLHDLGWGMGAISHVALRTKENVYSPDTVWFSIDDLYAIDSSLITVKYSFDSFAHVAAAPVFYNADKHLFYAVIDAFHFNHAVSYKIEYVDAYGRCISFPRNKKDFNSYYVGIDTVNPSIHFDVNASISDADSVLVFNYFISDNISVKEAFLYVTINGVGDSVLLDSGRTSGVYVFPKTLKANDTVSICVVVYDNSQNSNKAVFPENGFMTFFVSQFQEPVRQLHINFDDYVPRMELYGFEIKNCQGFTGKALHSLHPYPSSGKKQENLEFYATVNTPLILSFENQFLSFEEVVLVEPFENNAQFGERGFWDYVIVEGSKNNEDWYAFEKMGYDSRLDDNWLSRYYSSIDRYNRNSSLALGDESLYAMHSVNLLQNKYLRVGDTVSIRFRLLSDEFTYAWGWVIDNIYTHSVLDVVRSEPVKPYVVQNNCLFNESDYELHCDVFDAKGQKIDSFVLFKNESFCSYFSGVVFLEINTRNQHCFSEKIFSE